VSRSSAVGAFALAAIASGASAQLVEIAWDADGRFEQRMVVAPTKSAELCGPLNRGQKIAWTFRSDVPLNFNIHYHAGGQVVMPVQRKAAAAAQGLSRIAQDQNYCWMWTNPSGATAELTVTLTRSR